MTTFGLKPLEESKLREVNGGWYTPKYACPYCNYAGSTSWDALKHLAIFHPFETVYYKFIKK